MNRSLLLAGLIIALVAVTHNYLFSSGGSADLLASWIAGHFYQSGALDQIYAHDTAYFTLLPPPDWGPYLTAQGYDGNIYPFIYPPLWAGIFAWLTTITDFETVAFVGNILNPLLMGAMVILAWRASGSSMSVARYTFIAMLCLYGTIAGMGALSQNQPQILVSFLIVAAIERNRSGAPLIAGAALALAASIKLYPAVFAFFWLAKGNRRPLASFVVSGAALGGLSIALAGWPLHEVFLNEIRLINNTVLVAGTTFSVDSALGQLFFIDQMHISYNSDHVEGAAVTSGWLGMAKPTLWAVLSTLVMVLTIAFFAYLMRHSSKGASRDLLWPLAIACFALVSPVSWSYHYLPAMAFAPVLLDRLGSAVGGLALLVVFLPMAWPTIDFYNRIGLIAQPIQLVGTASAIGFIIVLAIARRQRPLSGSIQNTV